MKLNQFHHDLLAEVKAGKVWRLGARSVVERDEAQRGSARDVTALADVLHREYLIVAGRSESPSGRHQRRQYRLTSAGERVTAGA